MDSDAIIAAFELLLNEVEKAIELFKKAGAEAFMAGKLDEVLRLQGKVARVTQLRDQLKGHEQELLNQLDFPKPETEQGQEHGPEKPSQPPWWRITWTKQRPISFAFCGKREQVSTFKGILLGVCRGLHSRHRIDFRRVLDLPRGRKRQYFSESPKGMTEPREIPGTGLWVETNLSANNIRDLLRDVLRHFGHAEDALEVELGER